MKAYIRHQYDPLTMDKAELFKFMKPILCPLGLSDFLNQNVYNNIITYVLPDLEYNKIMVMNYSFTNASYLLELGRYKFKYAYLNKFIEAYEKKDINSNAIYSFLNRSKELFMDILQAKKHKLEYLINKQEVLPEFLHYFENKETISDVEELNQILITYINKLDTDIHILQTEKDKIRHETKSLLFDICSLDELGLCSYVLDYSDIPIEKLYVNISGRI